jgi:NADPH:quinone reductase-like Zn-dependent oxidoreductase
VRWGAVGVGDEVIALRATGAYAERVVVPRRAVVPKPPNVSFEEPSGLMLTGPRLEIRDAARLQLARQAAEGVVAVDVAASYPLADAAAAHRELATGHSRGKIILVP